MAGMIRPDAIDWPKWMDDTDKSHRVLPASAWREQMRSIRRNGGMRNYGTPMPWSKTFDQFRFRPGEVTLYAGENGSGKSTLAGNVLLGCMASKQRCTIASFEMKPTATLQRMCQQASMGPEPTEMFEDQFLDWTDDLLWLYDQENTIRPELIHAVMRYCAEELKIQHIVIDSLMKCVRGETDYDGQKDFVDGVASIARDTGLHVHLVHHMRKKGEGQNAGPGGKSDIKGSGSITDQVDNVFVVWRNKAKLEAMRTGQEFDPTRPDTSLICEKQRHGAFEGSISLWIHPSLQYVQHWEASPICFMPDRFGPATKAAVMQ